LILNPPRLRHTHTHKQTNKQTNKRLFQEKATHGLFFWCWKDGAGVEWSLRDVSEGCKAEVLKAAATKGNMGESGRGEVGAGAGRRKTLGRRGSEGGEAEVHDDLGNSAKEVRAILRRRIKKAKKWHDEKGCRRDSYVNLCVFNCWYL